MAEIVIDTDTPEPEPEIEVEEVPEWASRLSSEISQSNSLQRETLELLRNQTNLLPQVMETNANLTSQLQRVPGEIIELVKPLLIPPTLEATHPTVTLQQVEESALPEVEETLPENPPTPSQRKRLRQI